MGTSGRDCAVIRQVQLPSWYVQHLEIFIGVWILVLPFGLVERSGWVAIGWTVIIEYAVIGISHWAGELADPFGEDISDIPVEVFVKRVALTIKSVEEWRADKCVPKMATKHMHYAVDIIDTRK